MMRYILILISLFAVLLGYSQEGKYDYLDVNNELNYQGVLIEDWINDSTPSGTLNGVRGLSKVGNDIRLGGSALDSNVVIEGAGYPILLGTEGSKLGEFEINAGSDAYIRADGIIEIQANGVTWELIGGNLIINQDTGDTLAIKSDIQTLIDASAPYIPYNFKYNFSTTITDSRPGVGNWRGNNATYSNITQLFIDAFDYQSTDKSNFLPTPDTGSVITISDGTNYLQYRLTGGIETASSYYKYGVTYINHNGVISGLCTISVDISNSTGGGGGAGIDSIYNTATQTWITDTIPLSDTIKILSLDGSDSLLISVSNTSGALINSETDIIITSDNRSALNGQSVDITATSSGLGIELISGAYLHKVAGDTLFSNGEEGSTANNAKFKNFFATLGGFIGGFFQGEKVTTDTLIVANDTITGTTPLKTAIEATGLSEINFDTATFSGHSEGRAWYDEATRTFSFQNDVSGFTHNLGENNIRVYNNTASTITDGMAVRRIGTYTNGGRVPTIALAGNTTKDSSDVLGLTTVSIAPSTYGVVTILGDVNDLNTTPLAENDYYLGFAGVLIDTSPPPPYRSVRLGVCSYSDNDSGSVSVKIELPVFRNIPMAQGYFVDSSTTIPCDVGVEEHITNATNNLFIDYESEGITFQGDSMIVLIDGLYETLLSMSFSGSNNTITWTYGLYVNDVKIFEKSRTTGNNQVGDITVPFEYDLMENDVVKWKITNETNNDDPTITDATIKCKLTKEL